MRIFITGGTGLIGRRLVRALLDRGDEPVVLSRQADRARLNPALRGVEIVQGDPGIAGGWELRVEGCDAVINLVGHNLFAERWSPEAKRRIHDSRVHGTENVIAAIGRAQCRPAVLVQGSAIGYYGAHGDEQLTESSPPGDDFMAHVCREWEAAAQPVESLGVRLTTIRTGVVLARGEGMLAALTPLFKWVPGGAAAVGSGGKPYGVGRGYQWLSWIDLHDIAGIFLLGVDHPDARGPINGTSPHPERNVDFGRALAKAVRRGRLFLPWGPPDMLLRAMIGEVADVIVKGQKVLPEKALALGYTYRYPDLTSALDEIFPRASPAVQAQRDVVGKAP
jgi:uncharacterized protein (TIGR01777 family)